MSATLESSRGGTFVGFVGSRPEGYGGADHGTPRTPRIIELRTDAAQKVNRAYGTTGIITALEMPLAPAWPWIDLIVTFDDFFDAMQVGYDVALADGVVKKLITPMIWPMRAYS